MHMAIAAADREHWTAADWQALPDDGNRYEIIDGELFVTSAPIRLHQGAIGRLFLRIAPYVESHAVGDAAMSPADIEFSNDTIVQPDLFVAPLVNGKPPRNWSDIESLILAVEVLSPGTACVDRTRKRALYQREGVAEYWIVDVDARLVERWRPEDTRPEILTERLEWQPDPAEPPLVLELAAFFAAVHNE